MKLLVALSLVAFTSLSHAADPADSACMQAAKDKKLAGAAQKSFVKKCEAEAKAKCEMQASDKKLAGAARTSSVRKCVRETAPAG